VGSGLVSVRETAIPVVTLAMKHFGRRPLDSVRVAAAMSGNQADMRWAGGWGAGLDLEVKKRLEARGRDDEVFISLFSSLSISVTEVPLVFSFPFPGPDPAACA